MSFGKKKKRVIGVSKIFEFRKLKKCISPILQYIENKFYLIYCTYDTSEEKWFNSRKNANIGENLYWIQQGADFKNNQTTKQVNNYIWTNRKQVKFCFYLPIGPNKNCLLVYLFTCFVVWLFLKSAPRKNKFS